MEESGEKKKQSKLREFLGLSADTIQVGQFMSGIFGTLIGKILLAGAVVAGTTAAGVAVYEHQKEVSSTPVPQISGVQQALPNTFESLSAIHQNCEKLYKRITDLWESGDLGGVLALSTNGSGEEIAQKIQKIYTRTLINWKLFEDTSLFVTSGNLERSGDKDFKFTAPLQLRNDNYGSFTCVSINGDLRAKDFTSFVENFANQKRSVKQEIRYVDNGVSKSVPPIGIRLYDTYDRPNYEVYYILDGAAYWKGEVYLGESELPDARFESGNIYLGEAAIRAINSAKATQVSIRDVSFLYSSSIEVSTPFVIKFH